MKTSLLLSLVALLLFFSNCKKDGKNLLSEDVCLIDSTYVIDFIDPYYYAPAFNPNNPDEFVFFQGVPKDSFYRHYSLVKYNLATGETTSIFEDDNINVNFQRPRWSRKDWIMFYTLDKGWCRIKSNGDSLTVIKERTIGWGSFEWNYDGDKIICNNPMPGFPTAVFSIYDSDILYLKDYCLGCTWQHDSLTAMINSWGYTSPKAWVTVVNPLTGTYPGANYHHFVNIEKDENGYDGFCEWLNTDEVVACIAGDIYRVNIRTGQYHKIKDTCQKESYSLPTVSMQSQKILLIKNHLEITGDKTGTETHKFHLMNFDGTDEVVLDL